MSERRHILGRIGRLLAAAAVTGWAAILVQPALAQSGGWDEATLSLQVTLDRQGFSPGALDGRVGPQTRAALQAWQLAHGVRATDETDAENVPVRLPAAVLYTNYTVSAADVAELGSWPKDWRERSLLARMPFTTLRELVAERFHCRETLVRALNPQVADWAAAPTGTVVVVPNVSAPGAAGARSKVAELRVSLSAKHVRALDEQGRIVAHFPCSIGAAEEQRPVGKLAVGNVALDPNYTFDPAVFPELDEVQRGYGKLLIPPGPNNPVGTAWIGLSRPGYGIHGTPYPEDIGRTESHGCFRLANWNARRLAALVWIGMPVAVTE